MVRFELKKIGEIAFTKSGGTPSRSNNSFWSGNIPWLKSGELNDSYNIVENTEFINESAIQNSSASIFPKGTLLLAMYGATAGKLGILGMDAATNQAVCSIQNKKGLFIERYLFYYLLFKREDIIKDSFGGAQPNISKTYIDNILVPLPSVSKQIEIANHIDVIFEKIDNSISLLQENLLHSEALLLSIMDDEFGTLNCKQFPISNLIQKTNNLNPITEYKDEEFTYIDITSIDNLKYSIENPKIIKGKDAPSRAKKSVEIGDIVFATTRPNLKNIAIVKEKYNNPIASTGFCVLRPLESKLNTEYLFYFLTSHKVQELIVPFIRGAQYPAISDKDLLSIKIPLPDLSDQKKIVSTIKLLTNKINDLINEIQIKLDNMKILKKSLLDQAFKGEL